VDRPPFRLHAGNWALVQDVLARALDLPEGERGAFLDVACAGDAGLRHEVASLLAACADAGEFLHELDAVAATRLLESAVAEFAAGSVVGPYRIVRRLGRGGMGVVYLAEDTRLEREVALKFLPPHLSGDDAAKRRLLAEARASAALDHPNIGVVHEIGETVAGQLFIAMTCYRGRTLDTVIAEAPMAVDLVVSVGRQLALALQAAHRRGITHRDVKPSNVVLTEDGTVKLVDFGIATAGSAADTGAGMTPGTAAYMSPEQALGAPTDGRGDLWSLGIVLYEMLAGSRPASPTDGSRDDVEARLAALQQLRPDAPAALVAVVDRCLRNEPADRFPAAGDVIAALDALSLPSASMQQRSRRRTRRLRYAVAALAVLVLAGAAQPHITERVAHRLHATMRAGIARIDADASPDVYALYVNARHQLNKQNGPALRQAEQLLGRALDADPTYAPAWAALAEVYALSGWYFKVAPEDGYPRARAAAERALALDSSIAAAHVTLAGTFGNYYHDWSSADSHYRRALEIDADHASAHQLYAEQLHRLGRVDEALAAALRARELDPLSPAIERTIADVHYHARRFDDAILQYRKVLELYPEYTSVRSHLGLAYLAAGRAAEAAAVWEELLALRPEDAEAMAIAGYGYGVTGRTDDARRLLEEVQRRTRERYVSAFHRAALHVALGENDRAFALLNEAVDRRDILVTYLGMDPIVFNSIRSDPRYAELLRRIGMGDVPEAP
jgi:tetratricopeptide (TPR) repeat protein